MNLKQYHDVTIAAWKFFRKYVEQIPMSDQAWMNEVDEKAALIEKHAECRRFVLKLMTQIEDELEQLDKEAKL